MEPMEPFVRDPADAASFWTMVNYSALAVMALFTLAALLVVALVTRFRRGPDRTEE
jgi:hypothetical protein